MNSQGVGQVPVAIDRQEVLGRYDRLYFRAFAAVSIALVFAAFARSYFLSAFTDAPRRTIV